MFINKYNFAIRNGRSNIPLYIKRVKQDEFYDDYFEDADNTNITKDENKNKDKGLEIDKYLHYTTSCDNCIIKKYYYFNYVFLYYYKKQYRNKNIYFIWAPILTFNRVHKCF